MPMMTIKWPWNCQWKVCISSILFSHNFSKFTFFAFCLYGVSEYSFVISTFTPMFFREISFVYPPPLILPALCVSSRQSWLYVTSLPPPHTHNIAYIQHHNLLSPDFNHSVLSVNRVDLGFYICIISNFTPPPPSQKPRQKPVAPLGVGEPLSPPPHLWTTTWSPMRI